MESRNSITTKDDFKASQAKTTTGKKSKRKQTQQQKCKDHRLNNLDVYFIAWENAEMYFLNEAEFEKPPAENLRVHVFYNKGTAAEELPKPTNWIVGHESLTESKEAMWVDLTAYVISFYARVAIGSKCRVCRNENTPKLKMHLVCSDDARGRELVAVMQANKIEIKAINGKKQTFLDMFQHVCYPCKLIFEDRNHAEKHDRNNHNFLCYNTQCERSQRGNGFYSREELEKHLRAQKFCKYCPDVFCTALRFEQHILDNHKQCPCPCNEYFERSDDLMEHFYARYPLPCLEEPACDSRFRDIEEQAFHHESDHGSKYPYYCMACFKQQKLVCLKTAQELLDHVELENHKDADFKFAIIPPALLEGKK